MFSKKQHRDAGERLDGVGRALLRAAAAADEAVDDEAASSPFLYARLCARIAAERERREAGESWLTLLGIVWRSAPVMALAAIFAFVMFWSAGSRVVSPPVLSDEALLGARDAGIEHVVFADRSPLSSDEVLATLLNEDEREASR